MRDELSKKDIYIKGLLRNVDSLTQERDDLLNKMSELIRQNGVYLEKENQREKEVTIFFCEKYLLKQFT